MVQKSAALILVFVLCQGSGAVLDMAPTVHSDFPISFPEQWPKFTAPDDAFGLNSIFATGDWRLQLGECSFYDKGDCEAWLRLKFGSFTEEYFVLSQATQREYLAHGTEDVGFVGSLGQGPKPELLDLFAIKIGTSGGSNYLLVSATHDRPIKRLSLLSVACWDDRGNRLQVPDVDSRRATALQRSGVAGWNTSYCSPKSEAGLRALAVAALSRRPLAVMERVE